VWHLLITFDFFDCLFLLKNLLLLEFALLMNPIMDYFKSMKNSCFVILCCCDFLKNALMIWDVHLVIDLEALSKFEIYYMPTMNFDYLFLPHSFHQKWGVCFNLTTHFLFCSIYSVSDSRIFVFCLMLALLLHNHLTYR